MSAASNLGARREGPLLALSLAAAALALAFPYAPALSLLFAVVGAGSGALAGHRLAGSALRPWVPGACLPLLAGLLVALERLASRVALPATLLAPEWSVSLRDALFALGLSAALAWVLAFYSRRVRWLRPLPAALLVFAAGGLVAAHRGGSIHLPTTLSDLAWTRGWHPGLLLALVGSAAGLLGALALYRSGRPRWPGLQAALLLLLAVMLLALVPELSLFHFSAEDPLGLSSTKSDEAEEERRLRPSGASGSGEPRPGGDPLGISGEGGGGYPQEMVPFQDEYDQSQNQVPVAVVTLHDDVEPFGGVFYFRQIAFSAWNGRRLVRAFLDGADEDLFRRFPTMAPVEVDPPPGSDARAAVPTTVSLMRDHPNPPVLVDGHRIVGAAVADPALFRIAYRAESMVRVGTMLDLLDRQAGNPDWPDSVRELYLETPGNPRYAEIAAEAAALLHPVYQDDPYARAVSVGLWLQENTQYSTRSKHASAADPTASYLFGDRIGYCVHLAHATAYLSRSLGLPARVAAGYAYLAADRAGGSTILLRTGDAHAWAEVYLEGAGWVPIDPSPPSLDPATAPPDLDLQRLLGELARADSEKLEGEASSSWRLPNWRELLTLVLCLLAAWALLGLLIKAWRRSAPALFSRDPKARLAMRASLDRLAEAGLLRRVGETREAYALRVEGRVPSFALLTKMHLAASFGGAPTDSAHCRQLARQVKTELRSFDTLPRLLGLLSPWAWSRVC